MVDETLEHPETVPHSHRLTDAIRTVTSATFVQLVLEAEGPIVVEFMSYGCAHCRTIEPILEQVAEKVKSEEKIFRINIGAEPGLAENYEIRGTPTFVMFLNGQEVGRVAGPHPTVSSILAVVTQPFES